MASDAIVKVINRVTGRVRMWRTLDVMVRVGLWCVLPALALAILTLFAPMPAWALWAPVAAFVVVFLAWTVKVLAEVNAYGVAKRIDDEMGLKDRLTSALYFERSGAHDGLTDAAIADARRVAAQMETANVQAGRWHRLTLPFVGLVIVTVALTVGPGMFADVSSAPEPEQQQLAQAPVEPEPEKGGDEAPIVDDNAPVFEKIERRTPMTGMTKLEQQEPERRDPSTMDTQMDPDILTDIQNIKAALDLKDLEEMRKDFEDQNKPDKTAAQEEEKPVKMAPLDKELLDDLAAGQKKKLEKGEKGEDDAIGVAVRTPAQPGARQKGPRSKAGGGHGGGDIGESGDTRSAPKRVAIVGRDKLIIESRRSKDQLIKGDMERVVMDKVMMALSMKDVTMTGIAQGVDAQMKAGVRKPVVAESVPLGLRGYVQRYFNGIGPRSGDSTSGGTSAE